MMKKLLKVGMLATFFASMIFMGCSKKEAAKAADPNAPVTLTVWCWDPNFNIYAMNTAAEIYKRDHPNVTVNVVETPWADMQQKLATSLNAGATDTLPDIILMQDNATQRYVINYPKAFLPLDGKVDVSQFAGYKVMDGTVDGKHYSVPFDNGVTGTFLNMDIIEAAGLKLEDFEDITWDRFIELGKIVKEKTGKGLIGTQQGSSDMLMVMLQSAGSWFFDANGKITMKDNPVLKETLATYKKMVEAGVLVEVPDWAGYIATINGATCAGTINGCWIIGSIVGEPSQKGRWRLTTTPRFANIPGATNYSNQGGSSWMVMANSKAPEVAMDFLNKTFAGSKELYDTILPSSGAISTWLPAGDSEVYNAPHEFFGGQKVYKILTGYASKVPQVKYGVYNYEASGAISSRIIDIVTGKFSIDEALKAAQEELEFQMGM